MFAFYALQDTAPGSGRPKETRGTHFRGAVRRAAVVVLGVPAHSVPTARPQVTIAASAISVATTATTALLADELAAQHLRLVGVDAIQPLRDVEHLVARGLLVGSALRACVRAPFTDTTCCCALRVRVRIAGYHRRCNHSAKRV
jgi:hypothetical protein